MTKYIVNIYCREVWTVEAESKEEAERLAKGGQGSLQTTIDTGKVVARECKGEYE